MDKDTRNVILVGIFTLLGTILGASIPIIYSSFTSPDESYWINKGNEYYAIFDDVDAIECYDKAIKINPKSRTAWIYRALSLTRLEKYDEALLAYESAIQLNPSLQQNLTDIKSSIIGRKAIALDNSGKYDEALKAWESAIQTNPANALFWYHKAITLTNLERYDEAIKAFDETVKLAPNDGNVVYQKGVALKNLKRYDEANAAIAKAKELGYPS